MGSRERFEGFDFVSGKRGGERLGERLQWPVLEATPSSASSTSARGYWPSTIYNGRYVYSFR
jgi:hypothetical protein